MQLSVTEVHVKKFEPAPALFANPSDQRKVSEDCDGDGTAAIQIREDDSRAAGKFGVTSGTNDATTMADGFAVTLPTAPCVGGRSPNSQSDRRAR